MQKTHRRVSQKDVSLDEEWTTATTFGVFKDNAKKEKKVRHSYSD